MSQFAKIACYNNRNDRICGKSPEKICILLRFELFYEKCLQSSVEYVILATRKATCHLYIFYDTCVFSNFLVKSKLERC